MKASVSSYSYAQYLRDGRLSLEELPSKAAEMGFFAIEYIDLPQGSPAEREALARKIRAAADRAGLPICAYTVGASLYRPDPSDAKAEIDRLRGELEIAAILGAPLMRHDVCYAIDPAVRSFGRMLPVIAENVRRVTEIGASLGIRTCTENHGFIAQDSYRVEQLFNAVAHENYGLLVDIGNFICADEDSPTAVSRVAPYAIHVHAKDFYLRNFEQGSDTGFFETRGGRFVCGAAVGDGVIPVARCIRILEKAGYDGFVSIEYEGKTDCLEGISRGLAYLRKNTPVK